MSQTITSSALSGISSPVANEDVRHKHVTAIGQFFYHNQRRNGIYGVRFVICEVFNIVNVFVQIYLIDRLLGGEFSTYGLKVSVFFIQTLKIFTDKFGFVKVLNFALLDDEERTDPMIKVFPKITKCIFHNFGVSGSIQKYEQMF